MNESTTGTSLKEKGNLMLNILIHTCKHYYNPCKAAGKT